MLTPALLALSGAALLVGAFIIFNTFSITVAQRSREFALLRSLGATRAQILLVVAAEALVIGVTASVLGLFAGLGIAAALGALFDAALDMPSSGLVLAGRTIALALGIGIGVTLLAAVAPALRATRVPPVAALTADPLTGTTRRRRSPYIAAGVSLLGLLGLVQGLFGGGPAGSRLGALAGGAVLLFVGVALVARYVVRPLAGAIGQPLALAFDEPGRLARENAMRNPGRTATTSAALMVGLGLVVFVAVFAAGLKTTITGSLDELVRADIAVTAQGFQPLPPNAQEAVRSVPGVDAAMGQYVDQIEVDGTHSNQLVDTLNGVEARLLRLAYRPDALDHMRHHCEPAIGKRRIGADQFERRDFRGAERDRRVGFEFRRDAEAVGGADHCRRRKFHGQAHRHRVQRHGQRLGERDRAENIRARSFRLPALELDRLVLAHAVGGQSVLERGQIDEGLERGAGLPLGGDRAVELALAVIASADHGAHRAVRRHRHQRALADAALVALR